MPIFYRPEKRIVIIYIVMYESNVSCKSKINKGKEIKFKKKLDLNLNNYRVVPIVAPYFRVPNIHSSHNLYNIYMYHCRAGLIVL